MTRIVFRGVSPRSLGDLLKGYGIMAIVGEEWPDALFWWDDAFHLVAELPSDMAGDAETARRAVEKRLYEIALEWGRGVAKAFRPTRRRSCNKPLPCSDHPQAKAKGMKKGCPVIVVPRRDSPLKRASEHDAFEPSLARWARAIVVPFGMHDEAEETKAHPLFPAHGQEGSGDYFSQIEKAAEKAAKKAARTAAKQALRWSLFAEGNPSLQIRLDSGYLFFPESMKRYATGISSWEREKDAPRSAWCFLLALRGAMLFSGSLRRLRWGRRSYPAFPFVFEGSTVELGAGKYFRNDELHLPTWTADRPRTLGEFEMQVRQFQARLSARGFAATAAEFRAAVVGRGAGAAFDIFHRFVLEGRRPGQRTPMPQGISRGVTRVGGRGGASGHLRLMLAPLAETGWLDQFALSHKLGAARARVEDCIHVAVDEPGFEAYRGVLDALWDLSRSILLPGALRRDLEDARRTPRPLPPLPARVWEEALRDGLASDASYRLGRAIGSILGVEAQSGHAGVGPVLEHMLPVRYDRATRSWKAPDPPPSRPLRWAGLEPLADFKALLWYRWFDSADFDRLPFAGARSAPLGDIAALLRGQVDVREVHRLAGLFALLDWQNSDPGWCQPGASGSVATVPPAYAALRLWFELGIKPAPDSRPPRDGEVVRLLSIGQTEQAQRAAARALSRLRLDGLPWDEEPRPMGKAVASFEPVVPDVEAARLAVALMVPIARKDVIALSQRLWVAAEETKTLKEMEVTS